MPNAVSPAKSPVREAEPTLRTPHATIVRTPDLGPRQFYVLAQHLLVRGKRDRARYDLSKFTVDKKMIRALVQGVVGTGASIRFIAGIARGLLEADLLYPQSL